MDWFETLAGFPELSYEKTRQQLEVTDGKLRSLVNGKSYGIGELELVSLNSLRERVRARSDQAGRLKVSIVRGDVRAMHSANENAGALFQVASQFNLLEMTSQNVTPEQGVTGYQNDRTQGPACAIAAGAATIYRNYFAPVSGQIGQTSERQLDGLSDLGFALGAAIGLPVDSLWHMQNGYAMCKRGGLERISEHLARLNPTELNALRALLRVGVHSNVEVTDQSDADIKSVSQVFCSALPVAYAGAHFPKTIWESFATLILEAAYEATIWSAVLNSKLTGSNIVLLTRLGGGVFGNDASWIDAAMRRAFQLASGFNLDIRIVSYGEPSNDLIALVSEFLTD